MVISSNFSSSGINQRQYNLLLIALFIAFFARSFSVKCNTFIIISTADQESRKINSITLFQSRYIKLIITVIILSYMNSDI
jgi:hypothetical protein